MGPRQIRLSRLKSFFYGATHAHIDETPFVGPGILPDVIVGMAIFQQNDARHAAFLNEIETPIWRA